MSEKPPMHREPWTTWDDRTLRAMVRQGAPNAMIAFTLGRTVATVEVRASALGVSRAKDICVMCSKPVRQPRMGRKRQTCSTECQLFHHYSKPTGWVWDFGARKCEWCQRTFAPARERQKCCTVDCTNRLRNRQWYLRAKATPGWYEARLEYARKRCRKAEVSR